MIFRGYALTQKRTGKQEGFVYLLFSGFGLSAGRQLTAAESSEKKQEFIFRRLVRKKMNKEIPNKTILILDIQCFDPLRTIRGYTSL